jgi:hypothetical protein
MDQMDLSLLQVKELWQPNLEDKQQQTYQNEEVLRL